MTVMETDNPVALYSTKTRPAHWELHEWIGQECFTGKYTTHKTYVKPRLGPECCIFHILTSEDIDDVISCFFTVACADSRWKIVSDRFVCIIKRKLCGSAKIWILFSCVKNNILLAALICNCKILFLPRGNKIHIFAPPCKYPLYPSLNGCVVYRCQLAERRIINLPFHYKQQFLVCLQCSRYWKLQLYHYHYYSITIIIIIIKYFKNISNIS